MLYNISIFLLHNNFVLHLLCTITKRIVVAVVATVSDHFIADIFIIIDIFNRVCWKFMLHVIFFIACLLRY